MYLRKHTDKRNGRTYLSIARGYRDANGKTRTSVLQYLGELEELKKQFDDPVTHFSTVVDKMRAEEKSQQEQHHIMLNLNLSERLDKNSISRKNFGYAVFNKIYYDLEIDKFLTGKFKSSKISETNINKIVKLLVFLRLIDPTSKKSAYENRDIFFENAKYSLKEVYNALTYLCPIKEDLQQHIYAKIREQYGNNTDCVYYDVTNYYFEIDAADELRKKGVSKEHRPNPIVQMGLLMDKQGFPMAYRLFPGNTNDCLTLLPIISEVKKRYNLGKVIVVADKGLNTSDNVAYNIIKGNGYVYAQSIRGANAELKAYVLQQNYTQISDEYRCKSRVHLRDLVIEDKNGKKKRIQVDEKQVIFYSDDYARRAKAERQPAIDKAKSLIGNVAKYNKANSRGAEKYVKHLVFDDKTGEIIQAKSNLSFDEEKLKKEEQFDGYYAIVTNELNKIDNEIIEIYRGLWKIEESFRITKSTLAARPVYLSRQDHIESHFLTCYIGLVLTRILQHATDHKFSAACLLDEISKISCSHIQENFYLFDHASEVTLAIGQAFNIDFTQKIRSLAQIKNILALSKKSSS